jgi:hypothetical protein
VALADCGALAGELAVTDDRALAERVRALVASRGEPGGAE